jgi:hypothetical protein
MSSGVQVTTSLTPNIIMHAMACCGAVGREDYGERYRHTLSDEERNFFQSISKDFAVRPPLAGGPLFTILFQIPSYFPANNPKEIAATFEALKRCIRESSFSHLKHAFPKYVSQIDTWFPANMVSSFMSRFWSKFDGASGAMDRFSQILNDCYERFYGGYWPQARKTMLSKATKIQEGFKPIDLLEEWKRILGKPFPYTGFTIWLCEPSNTVSSIMAEKIIIPSEDDVKVSLESIVHESGVHFISPNDWATNDTLSPIFRDDMEGLIRMVEAAICYLKPIVLKRMQIKPQEDPFLIGMGLEKEVTSFGQVWEKGKPIDITAAIAEAYKNMK